MRDGFTLIEALIALVLFQIAMLALAASAAVAARDLAIANRHARAQAVAQYRVAQLRASACLWPTSGSLELPGGLTEHWRVQVEGAARIASDSVVLALPRGRKSSVVARGWTVCAS